MLEHSQVYDQILERLLDMCGDFELLFCSAALTGTGWINQLLSFALSTLL